MSASHHVIRATVIGDITAERRRQIEQEGWTPEHDDAHADEELSRAAACYALGTGRLYNHRGERIGRWLWPWDIRWWKPTVRRRDLIKAAALLVAEIERMDRVASADTHPEGGDVEQAPFMGSAVAASETPNHPSQSEGESPVNGHSDVK